MRSGAATSAIVFHESRAPDESGLFLAAYRSLVLGERPARAESARPPGTPWTAIVAVLLLLASAATAVALVGLASRYSTAEPGSVYAADEGSTLLMTSVRVRRASALDLIRSWFGDEDLLQPRDALRSSDAQGREAFIAAQRSAWIAAHRCLGLRPQEADAPRLRETDLTGASGGLMMALSEVASLRGHPVLEVGIAGTGSIDPSGVVYDVQGVHLKARGAESAGASLFLVPMQQVDQALRGAPDLPVVGVGTLDEALRHLGDPGCR